MAFSRESTPPSQPNPEKISSRKKEKQHTKAYEQGSRDAKAYKESAIEDSLASLARQKLRGTKMLSGEKGIREGESCLALVQNPVVVGWP